MVSWQSDHLIYIMEVPISIPEKKKKRVPARFQCYVLKIPIKWLVTLKQNASHLVPGNFLSSYNGHVSKSTPSSECCYDCGQGAVVCLRVISIWWLPQVHAGCELSGKLYPKIWYHAHEGSWGQCQCFPRQSRLPTPSSVTIRITGTYNPDTGVGTVSWVPSEDWLQGVTSSASQTSGVGVAVAQAFFKECRLRTPTKYVGHSIFW